MSSYGDKIWWECVNDRCGNLTRKTENKSADSEHHLVVIPGTFRSRWYMDWYRRKSARTECDIKKINVMQILTLYRGNRRFIWAWNSRLASKYPKTDTFPTQIFKRIFFQNHVFRIGVQHNLKNSRPIDISLCIHINN